MIRRGDAVLTPNGIGGERGIFHGKFIDSCLSLKLVRFVTSHQHTQA
jgi:hypothetical protein